MGRGTLRIYLGAAPGVGKTYAMLGEGCRRHDRGTDVVVGLVETHGRELTRAQIGDLEVVPRKRIDYRGTTLEEMDVDAILRRGPAVALVDELAHTNVPGSRNEKRWQDVEELLDAGITVISTLNIQHLESLNDVVERITGITQRETIPDEVARRADQIELVDMSPEALRRRMAHGNVYPAEQDRCRARQLLPRREPRRAPGARPPLGGRPRRRGARPVPAPSRHRPALGDPRARARRAHRRRRRRPARPSCLAHGATRQGRPRRRARHAPGRPRGDCPRCAREPAGARGTPRGDVPGGRRRRRRQGARRHGTAAERHADRPRRDAPLPLGGARRRARSSDA